MLGDHLMGTRAKELSEEVGVGDPRRVTRVFNHLYSPAVHSSLIDILSLFLHFAIRRRLCQDSVVIILDK